MDAAKYIWMNGEFVAWDDAKIHVLSHTLHYGNGVIEGTKAYIDDILVVKKGTFDEHLVQLDTIFDRCQKVGLKINAAEKCRFGLNEIDYLGYMVTPEGIKPNPKKIKAIEAMKRPTTTTEVCRLIGMVQ